jgi:hypothetical protein
LSLGEVKLVALKPVDCALVAHTCNPGYSGGRQRSGGSKFKANSGQTVFETLSQKTPSQKRTGGMAQGVGCEFKPQYRKMNK